MQHRIQSYLPPGSRRRCERCGFSFVAGSIWVIGGKQVNICRDCQAAIDRMAEEISAGPRERAVFIERALKRLSVTTERMESSERALLAALLGLGD
jgi:hypothetical protein